MDFPKFNEMGTSVATAVPYVVQIIIALSILYKATDLNNVFLLYSSNQNY